MLTPRYGGVIMNLQEAMPGAYSIKDICTADEELNAFLFSLGLYAGESVGLISKKKSGCIITVKNSRYSIDKPLAEAILVEKETPSPDSFRQTVSES